MADGQQAAMKWLTWAALTSAGLLEMGSSSVKHQQVNTAHHNLRGSRASELLNITTAGRPNMCTIGDPSWLPPPAAMLGQEHEQAVNGLFAEDSLFECEKSIFAPHCPPWYLHTSTNTRPPS